MTTFSYILAGGEGSRLRPLTQVRAKPAVPFGGGFRIIDFALSNIHNSGIDDVAILTQFKDVSLKKHLRDGWDYKFTAQRNGSFTIRSSVDEPDLSEYTHTGNAVFQNLELLKERKDVDLVNVFGGDHIYFMDVRQFNRTLNAKKADVAISTLTLPSEEVVNAFGVVVVDENGNAKSFHEKPQGIEDARKLEIPNKPGFCVASMGNYAFRKDILTDVLSKDSTDSDSEHDFGGDILPKMVDDGYTVVVYDFNRNYIAGNTPEQGGNWKDVGRIGQFAEANFELIDYEPGFNIYNKEWELHTRERPVNGPKFNSANIEQSIVEGENIITRGKYRKAIIAPSCGQLTEVTLEESLLLGSNSVGKGVHLHRVIVDKDASVPGGLHLSPDDDAWMAYNTDGFDQSNPEHIGIHKQDGYLIIPKSMKWN